WCAYRNRRLSGCSGRHSLRRLGPGIPANFATGTREVLMLSLIKFVGMPLFRILFAVEYHGLENVPETGPVILAGNHPSYLDPILVGLPVKRTIRFMAWDALFKVPVLGWLIRSLGAFPVDIRRGRGESAYRAALRVLESGDALGIFPEGQRSERGP